MSRLAMTAEQRAEVETAQRQSRTVRHWKRYQAVLLRADGMPLAVVAQTLGGSRVSVSQWTRAWRAAGTAGVRGGVHPGAARRLDAAGPVSSGWQSCLAATRRRLGMARAAGTFPL